MSFNDFHPFQGQPSIDQQLAQRAQHMAANNPLNNPTGSNTRSINESQPDHAISNPSNSNFSSNPKSISKHTYSLIIDYWFRTTKSFTNNDSKPDTNTDKHKNGTFIIILNKENGISHIIIEYCCPIFRILPIPKEEHGYGSWTPGTNIYSTSDQFNGLINLIQDSRSYNNKEGVIHNLLAPEIPINWDEEFVVIIVSHHGSPAKSIDLKEDEYEINKEGNALILTIERDDGRSDSFGAAVMAYYAFAVVVNRLKGFEKIGVKSRIIQTMVPQCTSVLPTDDLWTINRKMQQFYANLTPNDYQRNVHENVSYKDIN